jgi:hypothetical protein
VEHWLLTGLPRWSRLVRPAPLGGLGGTSFPRGSLVSTLLGPEGTGLRPGASERLGWRPWRVPWAVALFRPYLENCTVDASIFFLEVCL